MSCSLEVSSTTLLKRVTLQIVGTVKLLFTRWIAQEWANRFGSWVAASSGQYNKASTFLSEMLATSDVNPDLFAFNILVDIHRTNKYSEYVKELLCHTCKSRRDTD
ncbi:hypothetical protein Tsubulata_016372 [Turnera subulata]|uniref:Pentatricopeptide repeat-containing protein n=1 Tax=Turnera subulata TaxID=218843 RepID=A0A9Q0G8T3_9ROSI|nr:hypothetical protein Tsubulata_016372 [Turnera subulata]